MFGHRKQQTKQAFPFSRLFLANLVPGPTEVPYNYMTGPIPLLGLNELQKVTKRSEPKKSTQKSEPNPLPSSPFIPVSIWCHPCHWHVTTWCSDDVTRNHLCHHITIQLSDGVMFFLAGNPCTCVILFERQYLAQSTSASAPTLTISSWT